MIPAAAAAAAADVFERLVGIRDTYAVNAILEAAAPHLMAAAWERGYLFSYFQERGWTDDGTSEVPEHLSEDIIEWNPHRKATK